MRITGKVLFTGLIISFPLLVFNCQNPKKADPIKIGLIVTQTDVNNPNYVAEKERVDAAKLAIEEINKNGGVFGREFELIIKDSHNSIPFTLKAARDIIHEGAVAIVGPQTSAQLMAVADSVTIKNGVVIISPSATASAIGQMKSDTNNTVFRTCPSDEFQGKIASEYLKEKNIKTAAIIYIDNAYGQGLSESFSKRFTLKGKITTSVPFPSEAEDNQQFDFNPFVTKVLNGNPEAVYIVSSLEGAKIIKDISKYIADKKLKTPFLMGCDGNYDERMLNNTDKKFAEGMIGTAPANSKNDRNFSKFAKNFKNKFQYDVKSAWAATTYDAVYLIAYACACLAWVV